MKFSHSQTFTQRNSDTEELRHRGSLHTDAFTQTLLHAQAFQQRSLCTEHFYAEAPFHTKAFAQRTPEELFPECVARVPVSLWGSGG